MTALRYQDVHPDTAKLTYESLEDPPSLEERSLSSDEDLLEEELPSGMDSSRFLAAVRLHQESEKKGDAGQEALSLARDTILAALEAYREGRKSEAREKAIDAYLQGVEPVEKRLENKSAALVDSLEATMFAVREGIKKGLSADELSKRVEEAEAVLDKSAMALGGESSGYWAIFLITLSIILREGLEAFLIIIAILSVLRSLNVRRAAKWVHTGWLLALFIGIVSWFFADLLLDQLGMKNIEVMEGIGALTAVLILLFVGFWLHSRSEMSKWKELVEGRIHKLSNEGNMFGLGLLAFIVVFREAFESVIFLSAIRIGASEGAAAAIPMAAVLSLIAVLILAYIALHYAQRLPIRQLFRVSSVMLGLLAFVLMGKGIHAIQESGAISMTTFPIDLKLSFLGVYPTYETFIAQLLLIVLCAFLWFQGNKPLQRTEG